MVAETAKFPNLPPSEPQGSTLLAAERAGASFNPDDLKVFIYGKEWLQNMNMVLEVVQNEPAFDKSQRYYSGRMERFRHAFKKEKRLMELIKKHNWTPAQAQIADMLIDETGQFALHKSMFVPTIMNQGTEEQKKKFLEPALKLEIIGCYAQTELGHGSNLQGLETTATYIQETDEFEIHSPALTASKWWIGGLGKAANYAIVMARLITNGKDYGPHPFVVPIRSLEDHRPLKGIRVGDVGPKFGFNTVDNGYIMFDHYRIPRFNMLARFSQVNPRNGEYISPPNAKLSYSTMVFIRAVIVHNARMAMARAITIATRYTAVRRQFVDTAEPKQDNGKVVETPVLDYTMVQYRILPAIAQAYACHFTGRRMLEQYSQYQENMSSGDFSALADLHATSSGLKSLTTTMAVDGIETCRRAMGGHGYSSFSGLATHYAEYLPNTTWEGDNYILTQQTTRYLLKLFRQIHAGKEPVEIDNPTVAYMTSYDPNSKSPVSAPSDFLNAELILQAYQQRASHIIAKTAHALDVQKRTWNEVLVLVAKASKAHSQLCMVQNFATVLQSDSTLRENKALYSVMTTMFRLFALHTMEIEMADFLASGYISPQQASMLSDQVMELLSVARKDAVALVDAFGLPDYYLHSALGRYDGKVYETMTKWAEQEPLNQVDVDEDYEKCIRPFILAGKENFSAASKL